MSVTAWRNKARPHPDQEDHAFIPDANLIYAGIASKLNGERDGLQRPQIRPQRALQMRMQRGQSTT
jgi:hypothetical protein